MSKREVVTVIVKAIVLGVLNYINQRNKKKKEPQSKTFLKKVIDDKIGFS